MSVNAVIGTHQPQLPWDTIIGDHPPIIRTKDMLAGQGVLEAGTIVSVNSDGKIVPYGKDNKQLGTGDGTATEFSGTISATPICPGSVVVTDGSQTLYDDGYGRLYGDGSGTINYKTGKVSATFDDAPGNGTTVTASSARQPVGVLCERCDTDKESAAIVLIHGEVYRDRIIVAGADLTADDIRRLEAIGVFVKP